MNLQAGIDFLQEALSTWSSGGWLMLPLFLLAIFIYYTILELLFFLNKHFLIRSHIYKMTDAQMAHHLDHKLSALKKLLYENATNTKAVKRHFTGVRNEYLSAINGQIKFLAVLVTIGPLFGLLGTITGMFSIFTGMSGYDGNRFDSVVEGISEALTTTQTGLIISIPAFIILSLIIHRRKTLERCINRLEQYNKCLILKTAFPSKR